MAGITLKNMGVGFSIIGLGEEEKRLWGIMEILRKVRGNKNYTSLISLNESDINATSIPRKPDYRL